MPKRVMSGVDFRDVRLPEDAAALSALDTSFTTDLVYEVSHQPGLGFRIEPVPATPPLTKRFPIDDHGDGRPWDRGIVAVEDGEVCGFVATGYEPWNRRLVIWHFYVAPPKRRRGLGRALIDRALAEGAARGATTAWLETSSVNYPGVQAYGRLGFELCGLDVTLYRGTRSDGETALFLAREIPPELAPAPGPGAS